MENTLETYFFVQQQDSNLDSSISCGIDDCDG